MNDIITIENPDIRIATDNVTRTITLATVKTVLCPHCGLPNALAHEDGAVQGPREYHAECWLKAYLSMTDAEIDEARKRSPLPE